MNPVDHFEMPSRDRGRAARFHAEAFRWKMDKPGPEMGETIVATTAEHDVKPGAPAGAINGGLFPFKVDWPAQHPSVVIAVEDMAQASAQM